MSRVFLLSPASAHGVRGQLLLRAEAQFDLAVRLHQGEAAIGEVYAFISSLYFRGKVAYVERFASSSPGVPSALIIVPGLGLVPMNAAIGIEQFRAIANVPIHEDNAAYREPLLRDAQSLLESARECSFVLLGSIATEKYARPLLDVFGDRLLFPESFVGRGDMSRGGLMLRCAQSGEELNYVPVRDAVRRGARPPKLPRKSR
jgi:hypothetical protein